jgi:hypothetical protein
MLDRQTVLTLFEETAQVFLFNLDFIPDDKLSWKPAPDAKSVLEIINHLAEFLNSISSRLESQDAEFVPAANRSQAKQVLARSAERFASAVHGATAQALGAKFRDDMPLTLAGWRRPQPSTPSTTPGRSPTFKPCSATPKSTSTNRPCPTGPCAETRQLTTSSQQSTYTVPHGKGQRASIAAPELGATAESSQHRRASTCCKYLRAGVLHFPPQKWFHSPK